MADESRVEMNRTSYFKRWRRSPLTWAAFGIVSFWWAIAPLPISPAQAQTGQGTITLRADVQEANALTGVITARGNVRIDYPARDIVATSAQAQYFSEENRMILSGNVVVLQEGNRLQAETVTYLIDEGRFVALPQPNQQVETTYIIQDNPTGPASNTSPEATPTPAPLPDNSLNITPID